MSDQSLIEKVEIAIDEIRPYLIADGGDIKVVSIDNKNIVNLEINEISKPIKISNGNLILKVSSRTV